MRKSTGDVLIFTFVASAGLILYYRDLPHLWTWWVVMQLISLARLATLVMWRRYWSQSSVVCARRIGYSLVRWFFIALGGVVGVILYRIFYCI